MAKFNILIVEDTELDALMLKKDLEELGYNVVGVAETGKEALSLFYGSETDLVILDVRLKGGMDGIETANRISNDPSFCKPILFLTVDSSTDTFQRAKLTKPFSYLLKPYNKFALQHQIELAIHYFSYGTHGSPAKSLSEGIYKREFLYIKKQKKIIKVDYKDIYYAEVESNYTTIVTDEDRFTIQCSLSDFQNNLPPELFIRIHKNYLANLKMIKEFDFDDYTVKIKDVILPMGKKQKLKIRQQLLYLS